eukprot:7834945-Lingulodinium_polyedra.AAC.1
MPLARVQIYGRRRSQLTAPVCARATWTQTQSDAKTNDFNADMDRLEPNGNHAPQVTPSRNAINL